MKKLIKGLVFAIFYILVLPAGLLSKAVFHLFSSQIFFDIFAQGLSLWPGKIGVIGRACFYQQTLKKAYLDLDIGFGSFVSKMGTSIGRGVLITGHTTIGNADIGDHAVIANYVSILSGRYQHNFTDPDRHILDDQDNFSCVKIGEHSFIGDNCTIMADIGAHSIVGAASNVIKPLPDYVVAVGNPAKVIKKRSAESTTSTQ